MRIPTREEFSPLPELAAALGVPDPLAALPQLENRLEAVAGSTTQLQDCLSLLRRAVNDIETNANAAVWHGAAANQFRATTAEQLDSLRQAADYIDRLTTEVYTTAEYAKRIIRLLLVALSLYAATGAAVAVYLSMIGLLSAAAAAAPVLALTIIALVLAAIVNAMADLEWLGLRLRELMEFVAAELRRQLARLRDQAAERSDPMPKEPRVPGWWGDEPGTTTGTTI